MGSIRIFERGIAIAILALPSALHAARPEYHTLIQQSAPELYYQFDEATGMAVKHGALGSANHFHEGLDEIFGSGVDQG